MARNDHSRTEQRRHNERVEAQLGQLKIMVADGFRRLNFLIIRKGHEAMASLDEIQTKVSSNTSVVQSVAILIREYVARLEEAQDDPEQTATILAELDAQAETLGQFVASGTPAEEPGTGGEAGTQVS